jgi:hypothetical protein
VEVPEVPLKRQLQAAVEALARLFIKQAFQFLFQIIRLLSVREALRPVVVINKEDQELIHLVFL